MELTTDTAPIPLETLAVLRRKAQPDKYVGKSVLGRWFSRLVLSDDYLASLEKEQVLEGAFTSSERRQFQAVQRDCDESYEGILARAKAHAERLGRGYRGAVESSVIHDVITGKR